MGTEAAVGLEPRLVKTNTGSFNVIDTGRGSPLLLLHSLGTSNRLWKHVLPLLRSQHRLIVPDFLGHGRSSPPPREYTLLDHADSLVELMDVLGIEDFAAAGTSTGAHVSLEIASRFGARVTALVMNGGPGWHLESQRVARFITMNGSIGGDGLPRADAPLGGTVRPQSEDDLAERREDLKRVGRWYVSTMWATLAYDPIARLEKVSCPTLVLMGDNDFHLATCYTLVNGIKGSRLVVVPNAGHLTPYDDPVTVAKEISEFVSTTRVRVN